MYLFRYSIGESVKNPLVSHSWRDWLIGLLIGYNCLGSPTITDNYLNIKYLRYMANNLIVHNAADHLFLTN